MAANQSGLARLAGEVADGYIDHPIHGPRWTLAQGQKALQEGLQKAGRDRSDIHWNAWYYVAVNPDRKDALGDARATVAFYAGLKQYEPMFAAHGFEKEARACQEAVARGEYSTAGAAAVTDEMAETFVILGTPDECRKRVEEIWDVADSFCLLPPLYNLLPEKVLFYAGGIGEAFYS